MTIYHLGKIEGFFLLALFPKANLIAANPARDTATKILAKIPRREDGFFYHFDVTFADVWPSFREELNAALAARGIRVYNNIPDISRKTLQRKVAAARFPALTAPRSGSATEKLMVKPNFNYWGRADAEWHARFPKLFPRHPKTVTAFQLMERRAVPPEFWNDETVQIEKYVINPENKIFRVTWWNGRCVVAKYINPDFIKKARGSTARWRFSGTTRNKEIVPVVKLARAVFKEMNCDFGAADILADAQGQLYMCDLNPTPWRGEPRDLDEKKWTAAAVLRYLRDGIPPRRR